MQVRSIAEMGAYVSLLEYGNIEGMILLSELSRRRIRSVQKLIKVGAVPGLGKGLEYVRVAGGREARQGEQGAAGEELQAAALSLWPHAYAQEQPWLFQLLLLRLHTTHSACTEASCVLAGPSVATPQVGRQEPVMVLRVDKEKGYIDLSKRRVSPEDVAVSWHGRR